MGKWFKKNLSGFSDEKLIELYKVEKDPVYLGELYKRHITWVLGICLRYFKVKEDSEDAAMEIFTNLPLLLGRYQIDNFSSWLYQVTKNHCLKALQKKTVNRQQQVKQFNGTAFVENPVDPDQSDRKRFLELHTALNNLKDDKQKKCLKLFFLENKSYQEIAELTSFTTKQIKSYIQNGKRNLKLSIKKYT